MSASSAPTDTTEFDRMINCESYHAGDPYIRKVADEQSVKLDGINAEAKGQSSDITQKQKLVLSC